MVETSTQPATIDNLVTHPLEFGGHTLAISNFAVDRLINDYIERYHVWEPWQLNLLSRIIGPKFTCVDIGANIGINAMFAGRLCPKGRVIAFEPFGKIFQVLRHNLAANGLRNVTAINKGISDAAGSLTMVTDMKGVSGAHVADAPIDGADYVTTTAHFARLEDELREQRVARVDYMKIDVEGHEMKVLAGADAILRNPELQLTIEYNPIHLYQANPAAGHFADRMLFDTLKRYFRHLFFMSRDNYLIEINNWHAMRRRLMGGYFVDDLYCANSIRGEVADLIAPGPLTAPNVQVTREQVGPASVTYYNRDPDGWGMADAFNPPVVGISIHNGRGHEVVLKFDRMYRQHLPNGDSYGSWPVWVAAGDQPTHRLDLIDAPGELRLRLTADVTDITIQSEYKTQAATYVGNPTDPRTLGFRVEVH